VVRAYIQQYNDPPVRRYVAICGVENGIYNCPMMEQHPVRGRSIPFPIQWQHPAFIQ